MGDLNTLIDDRKPIWPQLKAIDDKTLRQYYGQWWKTPVRNHCCVFFQQPLRELLSRSTWYTVLLTCLPFLSWAASSTEFVTDTFASSMFMLVGFCMWFVIEYCMHRFVAHSVFLETRYPRVHFLIHGFHHRFPDDIHRVVEPVPTQVGSLLVIRYVLHWLLGNYMNPCLIGIIVGYICYQIGHYVLHHRRRLLPIFIRRHFYKHHMEHHSASHNTNFSVTCTTLDHAFHTNLSHRKQ